MAINKLHDEFRSIDMSTGWETPAGYPAGIQQKILSGALDEVNKRGSRTRLLRFEPGVHVHYQETVLRIHDSKPKMKDMPKEMGGSGVVLSD